MDSRKEIMLGILVISGFIFLITVLVFVYALAAQGQPIPDFLAIFMQYHIQFMVLMGLFGLGSGLLIYTILNSTIEKQKKAAKTNLDIIMKFLSEQDQEILELLQKKGGMTTQSEIAKLPGMTRLKAHRVVKKLEDSGIIHIEKYGKINMLRIVDELKAS
ncbi:Winged helix-turn-helix DNA-binding protein [Candidatus Gugararchaeum adminiculabundum]|nr:Winged helix-turn-helix DNA-binding protein [Candidatus Gugararchaeum adminiculabundum]